MDPVSAAASIISLLGLASTVVTKGYQFVRDVVECPKEVHTLLQEVLALTGIISALRSLLDRLDAAALHNVTPPELIEDCEKSLQKALSALQKATPQSGRRALLTSLLWPLKKAETLQLVNSLNRCKASFELSLTGDTLETMLTVFENQRDFQREQKQQWTDEHRDKVLQWVSPTDFEAKHKDMLAKNHAGTGKWFLTGDEYGKLESGKLQTLCCQGSPGTGKSVLMSTVIESIGAKFQDDDVGIAYFYFDYQDRDAQTTTNIFATLLKQLLYGLDSLPREVDRLYEKFSSKGRRPEISDIFPVFVSSSKKFARTILLFDAVDECEGGTREELLTRLHALTREGVQIFVTTRPHGVTSLREHLVRGESLQVIELSGSGYLDDLWTVARSKLSGARAVSPQMVEKIVDLLLKKAKQLFLLVSLFIEKILKMRNGKKMLQALEESPESLYGFYNETIERVSAQGKDIRDLAFAVLTTITTAARPLKVNELQEALAVQEDLDDGVTGTEVDQDTMTEASLIVDCCVGLVNVDEASGTVRLAHYTVQEFLLQQRLIRLDRETLMASTCLTYLCFEAFGSGACKSQASFNDRLEQNHFLKYAARHWFYHMRLAGEVDPLLQEAQRLLKDEDKYRSFLQVYFAPPASRKFGFDHRHDSFNALHAAATFGLDRLLVTLIGEGESPDATDDYGETALLMAAASKHVDVVKTLLENGVNANATNPLGETPLLRAAAKGAEDVAGLLLKHGVDRGAKDLEGRLALACAAANGHEAATKLFLDEGCDPDSKDYVGRSPLWLAACNGHADVLELILKRAPSVDVNCKDECAWTPLSSAAARGHADIVRILLGVDGIMPDWKDNAGWTPLTNAVAGGQKAVVRLLLEQDGVDPDAKSYDGESPLWIAASNGDTAMTEILLDHGHVDLTWTDYAGFTPLTVATDRHHTATAKLIMEKMSSQMADTFSKKLSLTETEGHPEYRDSHDRSALSLAAQEGDIDQVRLLLSTEQIEPDGQDHSGRTPLSWASQFARDEVMTLLLSQPSVDPNKKDGIGQTPLMWASKHGSDSACALLVEHKADVLASDRYGRTALHWAAFSGKESTASLILGLGADPNAVDKNPRRATTPLIEVARNMKKTAGMVRILLEHGASTGIRDSDVFRRHTALHAAAMEGWRDAVEVLLEFKADPNVLDTYGQTACQVAEYHKHEDIVRLLQPVTRGW